ncbi:hypothetical protein ACQYRI_09370 [Salmonella enterica]
MYNKVIKYIVVYALLFFSFSLFISTIGYYVIVFDWKGTWWHVMMNAGMLGLLIIASIIIYALAEKIKAKV